MKFWEICLLGIGLAMDAFAVSVCKGLNMKKINYWQCTIVALFFGFFQLLMPLIGYFLGSQFERYIKNIDHFIIFGMLAFLGIKMIVEAFKSEENNNLQDNNKGFFIEMFVLSIATSLDALAVGITFALLEVNVFFSSLTIGVITFTISFIGVILGNFFGEKFKKPAEVLGGLILILIGLKILLEHLGVLV